MTKQLATPTDHPTQSGKVVKKRPKVKRTSVDLCQRLSTAIENILIVTKNEEFRSNCLRLLQAENASEAGIKIRILAEQLEDKKQKKNWYRKWNKNQWIYSDSI